MSYAVLTQIRLLLQIRISTVCHSTKYFKKQLHKKHFLGQKSIEWSVQNFRTFTVVQLPFTICTLVLMSSHLMGGGHLFLMQIRLALAWQPWCYCDTSCLYNILWTNGWILTKFSWIYNLDITKNCLDFGYVDLIFKLTAADKLKIQCCIKFSVEEVLNYFSWKKDFLQVLLQYAYHLLQLFCVIFPVPLLLSPLFSPVFVSTLWLCLSPHFFQYLCHCYVFLTSPHSLIQSSKVWPCPFFSTPFLTFTFDLGFYWLCKMSGFDTSSEFFFLPFSV